MIVCDFTGAPFAGPYCSFVGVTIINAVGSVAQSNGAVTGRERISGKQILASSTVARDRARTTKQASALTVNVFKERARLMSGRSFMLQPSPDSSYPRTGVPLCGDWRRWRGGGETYAITLTWFRARHGGFVSNRLRHHSKLYQLICLELLDGHIHPQPAFHISSFLIVTRLF
ncbi:uncharacterized protein LACBIDRAFT_332174 [Laccaria bicolor S238N-H82]|uniref:Predicted protein n=1 Tax=Laccaria bicolor (strain S238N-H82 / ATCC MYA-4686) TaxID=486041 RepID=B0DRU4_LACBS|nr:uncharacterized protein LACBIDRAFT_332174 [Laccaria bicolor S238N-H82]EDR02670.1 predicted protein [Laccaria bicolor S238N-H82]|eukprot:XP_001886714.1 predicted protein [Laccaria bicolor S238N-H82]